ncbi:hypothetical protein D7V82_14580 [bacterium 1xD8-6]|nr:hypothetical protein D7V72_16050 [bacterium D16-36]RKI66540.1 hypothetical protein D7V82_14580 [bacterium 1xD8-6]
MDIKEFAKSISGKKYGYPQFTKEEIETAKENGFVIVYGASDDLMEFDGAIREEIGCYGGGAAWVKGERVSDAPIAVGEKTIKAIWCGGEKDADGQEITWAYETGIPHETFMVYEDGEPYCRGIVFSINDVA